MLMFNKRVMHWVFGMVSIVTAASLQAQGENRVVLSDTVTGNQEQPKVMYIVPWRAAEDTAILNQPLSTSVQKDIFAHLERSEHLRELGHLQQLSAQPKK